MAGKRSAGNDLNADNWDKDDEPEERGVFSQAPQEELKNRVIKKARRKISGTTGNDGETPKLGAFSSFSGFGKSNSVATTLSAASSSSPFSFLSKIASVTSVASTSSFSNAITSTTSKDNTESKSVTSSKNGDSKSSEEEYHAKLKGLNLAVLEWIKSHLDKNPLVILSPIFKDYEKHLIEIQKSNISKEKVQILSDFKFSSEPEGEAIGSSTSLKTKSMSYGIGSKPSVGSIAETEPLKNTFSFGAKTSDETPKNTFSFGAMKSDEGQTTKFSFGAKAPDNCPKSFRFGANSVEKKENTGFSFGSKSSEEPKSNFSIGTKSSDEKKSFSFGSGPTSNDKKDEVFKPAFSFGAGTSTATSTGFSFPGSNPLSFSAVAPSSNSTEANKEEEEESDEPPKVEFTQVEENDSIYSKKCKVFVKNEEKFGDRGVGTLHLKPVDGQQKTQLIVRADTNLGNLLLNMLLNESVPTKRMGKKDVLLVGVPMPSDKKPTQILIRVKTEEEADHLLETIEKQKKTE